MKTTEELLQRIQEGLNDVAYKTQPDILYEPLRYFMALGGKRLRPLLCLTACAMYDEQALASALKPAIGLELFHNFTLIHDDMMDRSQVRRNKPCVHVKWGESTAILSGDGLEIMAYQHIQAAPDNKLRACLELFSRTALEVCDGQAYDLLFESKEKVGKEDYLEMIRLKTAVLLACALKMGGILGSAPQDDLEALYRFGIHIGIAFQIQDDLLDVYGDQKVFGKATGGDIMCGKKTFLWIHAMEAGDENTRKSLQELFHREMERAEKVNAVTAIYNRLAVREKCEAQMDFHQQAALEALHSLHLPKERLRNLQQLTEKLTKRQV